MKLEELNPCEGALNWVNEQESCEKAWEICKRGDWMVWISSRRYVDKKKMLKAILECVHLVKHLMKDDKSLKALEVTEKYVKGEASLEELSKVVNTAGAYYTAADSAAYSAVYAALTPYTDAPAYAVYAAAFAASTATGAAEEKSKYLSKCADIVRMHISFEDLNLNGD